MQDTEATTADDPLLEGYHHIRMLTAQDAPWPGRLVRLPDGGSCVLVDTAVLGRTWAGWRADPDGHVLTPMDVVRRHEGHDAVISICLERVEAFLARRCHDADPAVRATGEPPRDPLDAGEVVTLAVSLLRGASEAARTLGDTVGEWWLTDAGRPVLALTGARGESAADHLLTLAAFAGTTLGSLLRDAAGAVSDARLVARDLDRLETALFGEAEPKPLALHGYVSLASRAPVDRPVPAESAAEGPRRWIDALAQHVDADLSVLVSDTVDRVRRRLVSRRGERPRQLASDRRAGSRRRPWLVAAGIAGGLVGIGMLWPSGGGPATADAPGGVPGIEVPSSGAATAVAAADVATVPEAGTATASATPDWTAATADLLTRRLACQSDSSCLADVLEDPTRIIPNGAVDASDREIVLLDEFGGVAVLRVRSPTSSGAQLAVVVEANGRLLLREVHDIAEQKG